jgi:hypothetical protein
VLHAHGGWTLQVASMRHLQKEEVILLDVLGHRSLMWTHNKETVCFSLLNRLLYGNQRCPNRLWSPPRLLFNSYRKSFSGSKAKRRESGHSLPLSAEVTNEWAIPVLPMCLYGVHRDNITWKSAGHVN